MNLRNLRKSMACINLYESLKSSFCYKIKDKKQRCRNITFALLILMNVCIAIYFMVAAKDSVVSNYLLIVFGANTFVYAAHYGLRKCYYGRWLKRTEESISWTCWVYIILAVFFGGAGLYFFNIKEKSTLLSPSQSRHLNAECTLWFFDKHDIWHFASALSLWFTFMTLLTLEDNNTGTPWQNIPVF